MLENKPVGCRRTIWFKLDVLTPFYFSVITTILLLQLIMNSIQLRTVWDIDQVSALNTVIDTLINNRSYWSCRCFKYCNDFNITLKWYPLYVELTTFFLAVKEKVMMQKRDLVKCQWRQDDTSCIRGRRKLKHALCVIHYIFYKRWCYMTLKTTTEYRTLIEATLCLI